MDAHTASGPPVAPTGEAPETAISLTELAATQAKQAMEREGAPHAALRVSVVGGGCSGLQYSLGFDSNVHADDTVVEQHGVRVLVDASSLPYLRGVTIDYVTGLHGAGFKFLNPNASRTCGCGSSFAA